MILLTTPIKELTTEERLALAGAALLSGTIVRLHDAGAERFAGEAPIEAPIATVVQTSTTVEVPIQTSTVVEVAVKPSRSRIVRTPQADPDPWDEPQPVAAASAPTGREAITLDNWYL